MARYGHEETVGWCRVAEHAARVLRAKYAVECGCALHGLTVCAENRSHVALLDGVGSRCGRTNRHLVVCVEAQIFHFPFENRVEQGLSALLLHESARRVESLEMREKRLKKQPIGHPEVPTYFWIF